VVNEFLKRQSDIETSLADANRFQHAGIAELAEDDLFVKLVGALNEDVPENECQSVVK
jgi:hypothetical protein